MEYTPKQPSNQKVKHVHRFCPLKSRGIWIIWRWNTRHPHGGPPSALWEVQIRSKEQPAWGKPMAFDQQSWGFFELFLQHFPSSKVSKEDQSGGLIWIYLDQVKPNYQGPLSNTDVWWIASSCHGFQKKGRMSVPSQPC